MRYTFVSRDDKKALLKKYYRRLLIVVGALVAAVTVFAFAFPNCVHSHGVIVVLVFSGFGIGSMLYLRSCHKKDGIDSIELQSYLYSRPLVRIVMVIIAIDTVYQLYKSIFSK